MATNFIEENRGNNKLIPGKTIIGTISVPYEDEMTDFELLYGGLAISKENHDRLLKVKNEYHEKVLRSFLLDNPEGQKFQIPSTPEVEQVCAKVKSKEFVEAYKAKIEEEKRRKAEAERQRLEAERLAKEKAEAERIARERAEAERLAREKAEQERLEAERLEKERLEQERKKAELAELAKEARSPKANVLAEMEEVTDDTYLKTPLPEFNSEEIAKEIMRRFELVEKKKTADLVAKWGYDPRVERAPRHSEVYDVENKKVNLEPSKSVKALSLYGKIFSVLAIVVPVIAVIGGLAQFLMADILVLAIPILIGCIAAAIVSLLAFNIASATLYSKAHVERNLDIVRALDIEEAQQR